jgi:hypothetical protein
VDTMQAFYSALDQAEEACPVSEIDWDSVGA